MSVRSVLLGALFAAMWAWTTAPVSAQSLGGLYVRADAAWSHADNANIRDTVTADEVITGPSPDAPGVLRDIGSGWLAGVGAGKQFTPNLRGDIVYTYRGGYHVNALDQDTPPASFKVDLASHAVMVTGYADFPIGNPRIVPFAGIGIGWAQVNMSSFSETTSAGTANLPGGSKGNFAWQVTAGAGFVLSRGIIVDVFYRYFDGGYAKSAPGNITSGGTVIGQYSGAGGTLHTHDFGLSVRFPITL